MISDKAFARLLRVYGSDNELWSAVHAIGSLKKLARRNGINPKL